MKTHQILPYLLLLVGILLIPLSCYAYRDLETGSFISRDPAGIADGPNLYTYVHQNPWTMFDPDGLSAETIAKILAQTGKSLFGDLIKMQGKIPILGGKPANMWLEKGAREMVGKTFEYEGKLQKYLVPIKETGFPDFSKYSRQTVPIKDMAGNYGSHAAGDFGKADIAANINEAYRKANGLTWHHNEDLKTMELIPKDLNAMQHAGGASVIKNGLAGSVMNIIGSNTMNFLYAAEVAAQDGREPIGSIGTALAKDGVELLDPGVKLAYEQTFGRLEGFADKVASPIIENITNAAKNDGESVEDLKERSRQAWKDIQERRALEGKK